MNNPWSNAKLEGQMKSEFDEFAIHGKLMKRGIQWKEEFKIKWFGIIIKEISYFQNPRLFGPKIGENEEHYELICKIKDLNLIKIQITSW